MWIAEDRPLLIKKMELAPRIVTVVATEFVFREIISTSVIAPAIIQESSVRCQKTHTIKSLAFLRKYPAI